MRIIRTGYLCLWLYHPESAKSHLISEAKQGRTWLVLGWENATVENGTDIISLKEKLLNRERQEAVSMQKSGRRVLQTGNKKCKGSEVEELSMCKE